MPYYFVYIKVHENVNIVMMVTSLNYHVIIVDEIVVAIGEILRITRVNVMTKMYDHR